MRAQAVLCFMLAGLSYTTDAAQVHSVGVEHDSGRYAVTMQVSLDVSAAAAYAVMTDTSALPQINHNVELAETTPSGDLHTIVQMCISFFCRRIEQVQTVFAQPPETLRMTVQPELSDFKSGQAQWLFQPLTSTTSRLSFAAQLQPDFWIPPLIGPWLVQRKLEQQARITSQGIERVARERQ